MFNRRMFGVLVLGAVLSVGLLAQADAAKGRGGGRNKAGKVEGTLVAASQSSVAIRTSGGTIVSLTLSPLTKIEQNDRRVLVSQLTIGARAQALFDPATLIASKVETVTAP